MASGLWLLDVGQCPPSGSRGCPGSSSGGRRHAPHVLTLLAALPSHQPLACRGPGDDVAAARKIVRDFLVMQAPSGSIQEGLVERDHRLPQAAQIAIRPRDLELEGRPTALQLRNRQRAERDRKGNAGASSPAPRPTKTSRWAQRRRHQRRGQADAALHEGNSARRGLRHPGSNVDPALYTTIRAIPDQAIGFEPGELRGAFTLYKPLD